MAQKTHKHSALPIHARLKAFRDDAGLSVTQVAQKVGVSASTWRRYERQGANPPSEPLIEACKVLGVSANDMFA